MCGAYARLGGKTRLMTQLGDDPFGDKILKEMQGFGIDTTYVARTEQANTALAFVSLAKDGNRTFSFYRNPSADMLYTPEQLEESCFEDLFALHFCSVSLGDFPMKEAHRAAIAKAREKGAVISFDPNLRFPLWPDREALKDTVLEFLPLADVLKVSDEEIAFLTGETDIQAALPKLFVGQVKLILFTCGKEGACAYTKQASGYSPCEAGGGYHRGGGRLYGVLPLEAAPSRGGRCRIGRVDRRPAQRDGGLFQPVLHHQRPEQGGHRLLPHTGTNGRIR